MNVLAIGAHFDDIELGCGGALAKDVRQGNTVYVFIASNSGFVNPDNVTVRSSDTAFTDAQRAMQILGIAELICGGFGTFEVEFAESLNIKLLRIIEEKKISKVYTHWTGDVHHDHQAVAKATIHCCRHVPRVLMYRSNWYESGTQFQGRFYVDITETWEIKEKALLAYDSEMERTGRKWLHYFKKEAENAGQRLGVRYAEAFELVKWLD
jgi:LmbE family N-acetylglucosaminyl deacetylase